MLVKGACAACWAGALDSYCATAVMLRMMDSASVVRSNVFMSDLLCKLFGRVLRPALGGRMDVRRRRDAVKVCSLCRSRVKTVYSSSRSVTLFIPFVEMNPAAGTAAGLSSRATGEGAR